MIDGKEACPNGHACNINIRSTVYKLQTSIIHEKVASEIKDKCWKSGSGIVSFKDARLIASHYLRLKKGEMFRFFEEMRNFGLIEIVPYHGIRINKGVLQ